MTILAVLLTLFNITAHNDELKDALDTGKHTVKY